MMLIRAIQKDGEIVTMINGTLEEIAKHYFSQKHLGVEEIEILHGGEIHETEAFKMIATRIYKPTEEEVKEFELIHNIRYCYKVEYKPRYKMQGYKDYYQSAGLCKIA